MPTPLRYLVNLLIKAGLIWIFTAAKWITIHPTGWLGIAAATVAFFLIGEALWLPLNAVKKIPCLVVSLAIVLYVTMGSIVLWLLDRFAEEFFQLNVGFWQTFLMGFLLTVLAIPWTREKKPDHFAALLKIAKK